MENITIDGVYHKCKMETYGEIRLFGERSIMHLNEIINRNQSVPVYFSNGMFDIVFFYGMQVIDQRHSEKEITVKFRRDNR